MIKEILAVFLGGGIGSVLRYGIQVYINQRYATETFPIHTWIANILGCFFIGIFYVWSSKYNWSTEFRLLLTTGLCGGFTTFSTFSNESFALLKNGNYTAFGIYLLLSISIGLFAVFVGGTFGKLKLGL